MSQSKGSIGVNAVGDSPNRNFLLFLGLLVVVSAMISWLALKEDDGHHVQGQTGTSPTEAPATKPSGVGD